MKRRKLLIKWKVSSEKSKLEEAEYFFSRLLDRSVQVNKAHFRFNLSAFLSATRSILQYSYNEVDVGKNPNAKPGGKAWYNNFVASSRVIRFFKDSRNMNIHESPINPRTLLSLTYSGPIRASELHQAQNEGEEVSEPARTTVPIHEKTRISAITFSYEFDGWPEKDAIQLCAQYLDELRNFINDGASRGYITG